MTRRILPLALLLPLAACSDLMMEADRVPTSLVLQDTVITTVEGRRLSVNVTVLDQDGRAFERLPDWAAPAWTTADASLVAVDGAELVAVAPGQAVATVNVAGLQATARVRVNPPTLRLQVASIHLTQAAQPMGGTAPLVAGRDAMLRAYLQGDRTSFYSPQVRVRIYHGETLVETLTATADVIPTSVDALRIERSWNVLVPGARVVPGMRVLVEADPQGAVPLASGSTRTFPANGQPLAADVREVPPFHFRMFPINQSYYGTTGRLTAANRQEFMTPLVRMFPVGQVNVDSRATYTTSLRATDGTGWGRILGELDALRVADGSDRYYYGVLTNPAGSNIAGIGYIGWPVAMGYDGLPDAAQTLAHELGHNFGRRHAPCGSPAGVDPYFPTPNARLDGVGFEVAAGVVRGGDTYRDLMSYCTPEWITWYTYRAIMDYRDEWDWPVAQSAAPEPVLLVWGSIRGGEVTLEPAIEMVARPSMPSRPGPHQIQTADAAGTPLYGFSFGGRQVADAGDGTEHFAFAVPQRAIGMDRLAAVRLSAAGGRATRTTTAAPAAGGVQAVAPRFSVSAPAAGRGLSLSWAADRHPMVVVRDPRTGEILSFARGGSVNVQTDAPELELLFSDGVRTSARRVRVR